MKWKGPNIGRYTFQERICELEDRAKILSKLKHGVREGSSRTSNLYDYIKRTKQEFQKENGIKGVKK